MKKKNVSRIPAVIFESSFERISRGISEKGNGNKMEEILKKTQKKCPKSFRKKYLGETPREIPRKIILRHLWKNSRIIVSFNKILGGFPENVAEEICGGIFEKQIL